VIQAEETVVKANRLPRIAFAVVILVLVPSAVSIPVPGLDLDRLSVDASLIAVGEVTAVQEMGKTTVTIGEKNVPARAMVAELRVDQVLKRPTETSSPSLRFHFALTDDFSGLRSVTRLSYRIFFLRESSGELTLANPYYPSLVAIPGTESPEGSAIERVIDQLRAVLESSEASVEQKREAIFALTRTKSPAAVGALKRIRDVKDVTLRLSVAAALLEHDDISTLQFAEDSLLRPDSKLPPQLHLLHNLSYAISEGLKDERAVPSLTRLLHASTAETRRAAASALMHIGSNSSIDPLLSALGDPDFEVRYYSVTGLAEITGQTDWRPNMEDFRSDQSKYLNHWRDWSQSR